LETLIPPGPLFGEQATKTNTEAEIYDAILRWMKEEVAFSREMQPEMEAAKAEPGAAP
jgi:hypothetical protein